MDTLFDNNTAMHLGVVGRMGARMAAREARAQTGRGDTRFHYVDVGHEVQCLEGLPVLR